MLGQTFSVDDVPKVFLLTFLELALSADNAMILGVFTHFLHPRLRRKAFLIGMVSAIVLRSIALISVSFLLKHRWVQLLGAAYLFYLSARYFIKKRGKKRSIHKETSFWRLVAYIELSDLIFAIDSIVTGIAFIGPTTHAIHPKLWIVYFGGMIGLFMIRYAAGLFSVLIDRFPRLETSAHLLIAWAGAELVVQLLPWPVPYDKVIFWLGAAVLVLLGLKNKTIRT